MGKIFYIMGKSASGKDTLYKHLIEEFQDRLKKIVSYTTRPIREGEQNGVEYFFSKPENVERLTAENKIIELREYQTIAGPWKYFTVNDGQINLENDNYLVIGTLSSYLSMLSYFGDEYIVPIYIELEDGERLERAIRREKTQQKPNYAEVCRRFLADDEDFSEKNLALAGIKRRFYNDEIQSTIKEISDYVNDVLNV